MFFSLLIVMLSAVCYYIYVKVGKHTDAFSYIYILYFVCIALSLIIATIYAGKTSNYHFAFQGDYYLYMLFSKYRIPLPTLSRLYNIALAGFMLISLTFTRKIARLPLPVMLFLSSLIAVMVIWQDQITAKFIYIKLHTLPQPSSALLSRIDSSVTRLNHLTFLFFIFLAPCTLIFRLIKSRSFINRKNCIINLIAALSIHIMEYVVFVRLFSQIYFTNVDHTKVSYSYGSNDFYFYVPVAFLLILILVMILITYFNPMGRFTIVKAGEVEKKLLDTNKNVALNMHMYKNAFTALRQQLNLTQRYFGSGALDKAEEHIAVCQSLIDEELDRLKKSLNSLNTYMSKGEKVDMRQCILRAIDKAWIPDTVSISSALAQNIIVNGSFDGLCEVFLNLISNAVTAIEKSNSQNPFIDIKLFQEDELCEIRIRDNGIGIKRDDLWKIFIPFYSTHAKATSAGLGLSFVQTAVQNHHGYIKVISKFREFTEFRIDLPIMQEEKKHGKNQNSVM